MTEKIDPARLRKARAMLRKSQETAARLLGVTYATYSRWENGHTQPLPDRREKVWRLIHLAERRGED